MFEYTATGRYYKTYVDGVYQSQHTTEREAIERANRLWEENPEAEVIYRHEYEVRVVGTVADQTGDTTPPSEPGSLVATAQSATQIDLTWTASTDNVGVSGYQIFRDSSPIDTVGGGTTSYSDLSLSPSTQYSYEVSAFDAAGNNSTNAGPALETTNSNSAPVWSLGNQFGETGGAINIDLDSVCTDADGDTITYSLVSGTLPAGLSLSGTRNETLSGTLSEADVDNFTLRASDGIASTDLALTFTVTAPDTTPPDAPPAPTVSAFTASTITLSLPTSAALDHSHYEVHRSLDGVSFGLRQDLVTTTTYQDTGLSASTQYWYALIDVDFSGNKSALGGSVSQTTAVNDTNLSQILFSESFESYSIGASTPAVSEITTNTDTISDEQASSGTKSSKSTIESGSTGFGTFGGQYTFPTALAHGDELWYRIKIFAPFGFDNISSSGALKWLRAHVATSGGGNVGYQDVLLGNSTRWVAGNEIAGSLIGFNEQDRPDLAALSTTITLGTWITYEHYVKWSTTNGAGVNQRVWIDGVLNYESDENTMSATSQTADWVYLVSTWNGGSPQTQSIYHDDWAVAVKQAGVRDDTAHMATDAEGNFFIGLAA